jgi:hypothetical protein
MKQTIILSSVLFLLVISSFFIKIPYNIDCSGKIIPSREWIVRNENGGDIISIYNDHNNKPIYDYIEYKFERGDIARIKFGKGFIDNVSVKKGDTVGFIASYLMEEKLGQLKGSLNEEQAYLLAIKSGEKNSLIESSKRKLEQAIQDFELQTKNFERQKALFEKQIIPAAEYEIAMKAFQLAKTNVELAKSNLATVETGEKPELINYSNAKIGSVSDELRILNYKQKNYALVAPFGGKIVTKKLALNNPETTTYNFLHIIDTTEYIVLLPIELFQRKYITSKITFTTSLSTEDKTIEGVYVGENQDVELTRNFKQVYIIKGSIKPDGIQIPYGIYANCTINCGKVSLFEYIKRKIRA